MRTAMKSPGAVGAAYPPPTGRLRLGGQEGQLLRATKDVYRNGDDE